MTQSRYCLIGSVITSGASLVCLPASICTGCSLCAIGYNAMSLGGQLYVGSVVTAGAFLISVPAILFVGRSLCIMLYDIVTQRGYCLVGIVITTAADLVSIPTGGRASSSLTIIGSGLVTQCGNFLIRTVTTGITGLIFLPANFCTGSSLCRMNCFLVDTSAGLYLGSIITIQAVFIGCPTGFGGSRFLCRGLSQIMDDHVLIATQINVLAVGLTACQAKSLCGGRPGKITIVIVRQGGSSATNGCNCELNSSIASGIGNNVGSNAVRAGSHLDLGNHYAVVHDLSNLILTGCVHPGQTVCGICSPRIAGGILKAGFCIVDFKFCSHTGGIHFEIINISCTGDALGIEIHIHTCSIIGNHRQITCSAKAVSVDIKDCVAGLRGI